MILRKLSLILVMCLLVGCFSGCSVTEIECFSLIEEYSTINSFEFNSSSLIKVSESFDEYLPNEVQLKLSGKGNIEDSYMTVNIDLASDKGNFNGNLKFTEGGIFIPKSDLLNIYSSYLIENTVFSELTIGKIKENIEFEMKGIDYVCLDTFNVFNVYNEFLGKTDEENGLLVEEEVFLKFLNYIFDLRNLNSFNTNSVLKTDKGFKIYLTSQDAYDIFYNYLVLLEENSNQIEEYLLNGVEENGSDEHLVVYSEDISLINNSSLSEEVVVKECSKEEQYINAVSDIIDFIKSLKLVFSDESNIAEIKKYDGSDYTLNVIEKDGVLCFSEVLKISENNESICSINTEMSIKSIQVEPEICSGIPLEDFVSIANESEYKINPVEILEGEWMRYNSDKKIYLELARIEGTEDVVVDFIIKDDRVYLPLRQICEFFGENVVWDSIQSKAFIVRGNDKIDMTGFISDGRTFIKIRDFEKLGYEVSYSEEPVMNRVKIVKKIEVVKDGEI